MSFDRREGILARLVEVAGTIPGIKNVERNQTKISAHRRPAIVVFDSDERGAEGDFVLGRQGTAQGIFSLTPEVYILSGTQPVGSDLSAFRMLLVPAVLTDPTLKALTDSGGIQYQGCITDLGKGRTMEGEMHLIFDFHYALLSAELQ